MPDTPDNDSVNNRTAPALNAIFRDFDEFNWALDMAAEILRHAGITSPDDVRFAVNTPHGGQYFTLYISTHVVWQIERSHADDRRALLMLYADNPAFNARWRTADVMNWPQGYAFYRLPIAEVRPPSGAKWAEIKRAVRDFVGMYNALTRSARRNEHRADLGQAIFNKALRRPLFEAPAATASPAVADMLARLNRAQLAEKAAKAEALRQQIIAEFPLEAWPDLPLERYALGQAQPRGTWSWWLEFGARELGSIAGGSARKFQIHKHRNKAGWYFKSQYADVEAAWRDLRAAYVQLFELVAAGRWQEAAQLEPLAGAQVVRIKSAYIYFPDRLLPIYSHAHLAHYLKLLDAWEDGLQHEDALILNRRLLMRLRQEAVLENWSTYKRGGLLWLTSKPTEGTGPNAYLFAWNPDRWRWEDGELEALIQRCRDGEKPADTWSSGQTKRVAVGDRAYFIRLGSEPRGIFAAGTITRASYPRPHWDKALAAAGKTEFGVDFAYDYLIDPRRDPQLMIPYEMLTADPRFSTTHWSIQSSGAAIDCAVASALEAELDKLRGVINLPPPPPPPPPPTYTSANFQRDTFLTPDIIDDLLALHRDKPQLIFYGPPGTGKTYIARHLARLLTGLAAPPDGQVELVQFHPSYGYEEFIEGIRPTAVGGHVEYPVEPGLFLRFCARAQSRPDLPHVLIIDEINRGNLPRIFGELLLLLEYRDEQVTLPYSRGPFSIPRNVTLIGTMNTADRSIALVDFALRRRFHFVRLPADRDLYRRWFAAQVDLPHWLPELYDLLHAAIDDDDFRIGHSVLMKPGLTAADAARIWRYTVMPHLREYYFDRPEQVQTYAWEGERVQRILGANG